MFERYNIVDLYIASIRVIEPENRVWSQGEIIGGSVEYSYNTIIKKVDGKYIDLIFPDRNIVETRDKTITSYILEAKEPLWHYEKIYMKKQKTMRKNKALKTGAKYYPQFNDKIKTLVKK